MIKKLDILVIQSFLRPFLPTFLVMILFFLMQMVWMYIDDLAGRGIEWYYILELLFYWSAGVLPIALPISVLLSSLTTFGTFGENNELAAMKSAGIPLFRIMRPLIVFIFFLSIGAFLFYNFVIPVANLKSEALVRNISKQKPALNIRQGIFNADIENYSIKVGNKTGEDGNNLENIIIYDHTDNSGNTKMTIAKTGLMAITEDSRYMEIFLYDGHAYEEVKAKTRQEREKKPFIKASFDEAIIRFDLRQFQTGDLRESNSRTFYMMNVNQLDHAADSLINLTNWVKDEFAKNFSDKYYFSQVTLDTAKPQHVNPTILANLESMAMKKRAVENALRLARSNTEFLNQKIEEYDWRERNITRHFLEWHKKFSLSIACFVLFFIGAPLGAIIRKGGIGMPVVISFLVFITYHIINTSFEKTGREMVIEPWAAVWIGTLILAPFGFLLTYKAATDSSILNSEFYTKIVRFVVSLFKRKKDKASA